MATTKRASANKPPRARQAKAAAATNDARDATIQRAQKVSPNASTQRAVPDKAEAADKADKAKKPKLVRDSFTIPKTEYALFDQLKLRASRLGRPAKKSEVLRAGVQALAAMGDAAFLAAIGAVPSLKTGRPPKH